MTRHARHPIATAFVTAFSIRSSSAFHRFVTPAGKGWRPATQQKAKSHSTSIRSSIGEEQENYMFRDLMQKQSTAEAVIRGSIESVKLRRQSIDEDKILEVLAKQIGSVSKERLMYPELADDETRLFSNIRFEAVVDNSERLVEDEDNFFLLRDAGSTLSAAALVAGSTIGAGILALPAATVSSGFLPSSGGLILAWVFMTMSGLLLAELTINRMAETGRVELGVLDLFQAYLGKWGHCVGSAVFFLSSYLIMMAYLSQGGANLTAFINGITGAGFSSQDGQILFASVIGLLLFLAKDKHVKQVNNVLVAGTCATFLSIIAYGTSSLNLPELLSPIHSHPENIMGSAPILLLSLSYQSIVPTVVKQLEGDRKKITNAITLGTLGPLVMFLLWNGIILGNVYNDISSEASLAAGAIDPVMLLQKAAFDGGGNGMLPGLVSTFSELTTVACLIGLFYGLMNAWTDTLQVSSSDEDFNTKWKPLLISAILIPSLTVSLGNPDIFYSALEYGGAFGASVLWLLLPALMSWKNRYADESKPVATLPIVPGGKLSLGTLCQVSTAIIVQQGAEKLGLFDFGNGQWGQNVLFELNNQFAQINESTLGLLS